jgi:hypothetical protein
MATTETYPDEKKDVKTYLDEESNESTDHFAVIIAEGKHIPDPLA